MKPWYDAITGDHLWPFAIAGIRHFASVDPLPGAVALCGQTAGADYASDAIAQTCPACAEAVCNIRVVTPLPEPTPDEIAQQISPLGVVAGLVGNLPADEQAAVLSVAQGIADGSIAPGELLP